MGCDVPDFWEQICAGKSGVTSLGRFDASDYKVQFGGEVKHFDCADHMEITGREVKRFDRFVQ